MTLSLKVLHKARSSAHFVATQEETAVTIQSFKYSIMSTKILDLSIPIILPSRITHFIFSN